jgi:hypothetical protein
MLYGCTAGKWKQLNVQTLIPVHFYVENKVTQYLTRLPSTSAATCQIGTIRIYQYGYTCNIPCSHLFLLIFLEKIPRLLNYYGITCPDS